jgi:hypothetical protein
MTTTKKEIEEALKNIFSKESMEERNKAVERKMKETWGTLSLTPEIKGEWEEYTEKEFTKINSAKKN